MDTEALRWFALVADGLTVTEVSDLHQTSQPTVSRALARLEEQVGMPLLRRQGRNLRLTRAGAAFKRHVDALVTDLDDGLAELEELTDPGSGTIALSYQPTYGGWLVPRLARGFRAQRPRVRFDVRQGSDERVFGWVESARVDLAITAARPATEAVRWEPFLTEPLLLAVPADHALTASEDPVTLSDAAGEPWVLLRRSWTLREQVDGLLTGAGLSTEGAIEVDDVLTQLGMVAAGFGVAVVPGMGRTPGSRLAGCRLLPLAEPSASRVIGLAWSSERRLLPAVEDFRRFVLDGPTRAHSRWPRKDA